MGSLRSLRKEAAKMEVRELNKAMNAFLEQATVYYDLPGGMVWIESFDDYWRVIAIVEDTRRVKAFVKKTTGEIFKPRSIEAPVEMSYGNIFNRDNGLSGILRRSRK